MENLFFDLKKLKYLGEGAIVGKAVRIRRPELVSIGDFAIIDDFTYISCEMDLGAYCHIGSNVNICGGAKNKLTMGKYSGLSAGCSVYVGSSDYVTASFELPGIPVEYQVGGFRGDIVMGDHVLLGAHSVVLPGVVLPDGFATTAHTVVGKREYEAWTLYSGDHCRKRVARRHEKALKAQQALESRATR